ncbi:Protein of unknown function [Thermomonospora echinospora]|uniref:DUF2993 domain-containing protein n=1 Tax=Thermomonospora echinospora TaxID=1992 RepID=A0A1H6D2N0_9ACTN|nr:DUF2993 domain-containing protein [Thermomonospora echinospora]SEG79258.1 Protein of unknown function [Thermomonospora echinospora]
MRKVLVVFLILLVGGVIAADRIGVRMVQNEIGERVAAQYDLPRRPEVTIHGFPFLTQAIGGEYDRIDVAVGDYTQQRVTVKDVRIEMRGVQAPLDQVTAGNTANVVVRAANASAVIPYELMRQYAPKQVTGIKANGPDLQVDLSGSLGGLPVSGTAVVSVEATEGGVRFTPRSVGTGGVQIPVNLVRQQLAWTVPVRDLPIGSRISRVEVTPDGVRVAATAQNVNLGALAAG